MKFIVENKKKRSCPRCRVALKPDFINGIEVDECTSCHGIWFDEKELENVIGTSKGIQSCVTESERVWKETSLTCPSCGNPLECLCSNPVFSFDLDLCNACQGVWVDQPELGKAEEALRKGMLRLKKLDQPETSTTWSHPIPLHPLSEIQHRKEENAKPVQLVSFWDLEPGKKLVAFLGLPVESGSQETPARITLLMLLINLLVFLMMTILSQNPWIYTLFLGFSSNWYNDFGFTPALFEKNLLQESYKLVTSTFVHGDVFHLIGNLYFLYMAGDDVEKRMGPAKYLLFYLAGGVIANLVSWQMGLGYDVPHVGASGSISAVMGAYMILCPHKSFYVWFLRILVFGNMISFSAWIYLLFWFGTQFLYQFVGDSQVDHWAHIGGFVFGALSGILVRHLQTFDPFSGEWKWRWKAGL